MMLGKEKKEKKKRKGGGGMTKEKGLRPERIGII